MSQRPQPTCEQAGVCLARTPRCPGCPAPQDGPFLQSLAPEGWSPGPHTPPPRRHGVNLWALLGVLLCGLSAAAVGLVLGIVWGKWGPAIAAAWASLLLGA